MTTRYVEQKRRDFSADLANSDHGWRAMFSTFHLLAYQKSVHL